MPDREPPDSSYIDITDLLVLPQKEAAKRLGISESMLCKRFKECTRRKWPFRYLRKIEKVICALQAQDSEGTLLFEEKQKLKKLLAERDACLQPVQIRISAFERLSSEHSCGKACFQCAKLTLNGKVGGVDQEPCQNPLSPSGIPLGPVLFFPGLQYHC